MSQISASGTRAVPRGGKTTGLLMSTCHLALGLNPGGAATGPGQEPVCRGATADASATARRPKPRSPRNILFQGITIQISECAKVTSECGSDLVQGGGRGGGGGAGGAAGGRGAGGGEGRG